MKFYSEKLDRLFDTAEDLAEAEAKVKKKKKAIVAQETTEAPIEPATEQPTVPSRKELATAVETAEAHVKEAYSNYEAAKAKAEEVSKKYLEEINNILEPAKKAVKVAETARYEAIRNFNESYGAYQVTYTGARAAEEMVQAINNINARANKMFRDLFWF